ncbi:hypothetical protein DIPPA_08096 [Diplonema papillatum]|nr:hypothetical protein DIPPA_08096 [Diplonema papillatum]
MAKTRLMWDKVLFGGKEDAPASPKSQPHMCEAAAQTDCSIVRSQKEFEGKYAALETEHWLALRALKEATMGTVSAMGGCLFDLLAFKNVAGSIPGFEYAAGAPLTDLYLISSKFYRTMSLLTRQLSTFFDMVFAHGVADEEYHFTEFRLTKATLKETSAKLLEAKEVATNLESRVKAQEARIAQQQEFIARLEETRDTSEKKSLVLEDQMSVLFQAIADDYIYYNEEQLRHAVEDSKFHERMAPVRSAFSHSIDAVQHRLKFFQDLIAEITIDIPGAASPEAAASPPAEGQLPQSLPGPGAPMAASASSRSHAAFSGSVAVSPSAVNNAPAVDKTKLKSLEVHLYHLTSRFSAVREGLLQTARELHTALLDKKKVVTLSVQHLKAYEHVNAKLQQARLRLADTRKSVSSYESLLKTAFPKGALLSVDEQGCIQQYLKRSDGTDEIVSQPTTLPQVTAALEAVSGEVMRVSEIVSTSEEHRQLMKTVALSIPSGPRGQNGGKLTREAAHQVRSCTQQVHEALAAAPLPPAPAEDPAGDSGGRKPSAEDVFALKAEYAGKVSFIREVYEDRIRSLEAKVELLVKKLVRGEGCVVPDHPRGAGGDPLNALTDEELSVATKRQWLLKKEGLVAGGEAEKRRDLIATLAAECGVADLPASQPGTDSEHNPAQQLASIFREAAAIGNEASVGGAENEAAED